MRILVLSHGHPDLAPGGGERAAYALFQHLRRSPAVTHTAFGAAAGASDLGPEAPLAPFRNRSDEFLVATPPVDGFTHHSIGYDALKHSVAALIQAVKPDVVHLHHFLFWGVEVFELFQQAGVRVILTLHEYAAICAHYGQMIKPDGALCYAASPRACGECFPTMGSGKAFVRATLLKSYLHSVDRFIAPSAFLRRRYLDWGLPPERISVIENLLDVPRPAHACALKSRSPERDATAKTVFGFFGQVTPFKGLDVLLEAATVLPDDVRPRVEIRIHGENRHYRDTTFHRRAESLLAQLPDVVTLKGAYVGGDVLPLMEACDWIVVPSIWWENSPVVIQEARLAARPLIGAALGGIAEKLDPAVDLLVPARSPGALAEAITTLIRSGQQPDRQRLNALALARAKANESLLAQHEAVYREVLTGQVPSPRL